MTMTTSTSKIYKAISAIMNEVDFIAKDRKNPQQGYAFRGIDDVYAALQKIMAKHGVFCVPNVIDDRTEERQTKNGSSLIYRILKIEYTFFCDDGSSFKAVVIGEGMDSGDKASNKAMSVAQKYALLQVFCIPTSEAKDPENDTPEDSKPKQEKQASKHPDKPAPSNNPSSAERILRMIDSFGLVGVDTDMIKAFLKKPTHEATEEDLNSLKQVYAKIARGASPLEFFKS